MERFEEARRWFLQALRDLRAAGESLRTESYEWSSFQSQQAAEKAVKALGYALGRISWGHSVTELLEGLRESLPEAESYMSDSRELDRHYIPSRYPNAFESGYPALYYDIETAGRAVECARRIIDWVEGELKRLGVKI